MSGYVAVFVPQAPVAGVKNKKLHKFSVQCRPTREPTRTALIRSPYARHPVNPQRLSCLAILLVTVALREKLSRGGYKQEAWITSALEYHSLIGWKVGTLAVVDDMLFLFADVVAAIENPRPCKMRRRRTRGLVTKPKEHTAIGRETRFIVRDRVCVSVQASSIIKIMLKKYVFATA